MTREQLATLQPGDKVVRTGDSYGGLVQGEEYTVESAHPETGNLYVVEQTIPSPVHFDKFDLVGGLSRFRCRACTHMVASLNRPTACERCHYHIFDKGGYGPEPTVEAVPEPPPAPLPPEDPAIIPGHYTNQPLEPMRVAVENAAAVSREAARWVILKDIQKYTTRAPNKNGHQDLAKAGRCLEMLAKFDSGDADWWKPGVINWSVELLRHG